MADTTQASHEAFAQVGRMTEAHTRFKPFAGAFRAEVRMWMGPGDPLISTGIMTNSLDLGGRYLHQSYKGDPNPGPFPAFEGRGYWGYNTIDKRYEGFWIDNACTFMQVETGQVDSTGKVWTMHSTMTDPQTGQPMKKKSVITLRDESRHTMEMFFEVPGAGYQKSMHIEYTRA
jgi:hypothetical protein